METEVKHHFIRWEGKWTHCYYCPCREWREFFRNNVNIHSMCELLNEAQSFLYAEIV